MAAARPDIGTAYDAHKQSMFFRGPRPIYQARMDFSYSDQQRAIDEGLPRLCADFERLILSISAERFLDLPRTR